MTAQDTGFDLEVSRRKLIAAAGIAGAAILAAPLIGTGDAEAAPAPASSPDPVATPPVAGLHLQFGSDASSEIVVSWHTLHAVTKPKVIIGRLDGDLERIVNADPAHYVDAKSGQTVYAYHAAIGRLRPDTDYL